ncbi:MAG: acetyl-CoA carboxylase biotin carboxyl carrier protein [Ignavibacteriae bacterium]|nr:acetyl-CoA carboxylase biotin carboxyl carrier protein [Ignavibacteria bacterium]MBI3363719.1 acetyl-CoA carboxylase biotin carboxyl carrier protein [Ignavibacteriota bacterium]
MDLAYLKKLVRILEHSGVDEIEIEEEGLRVRVARNSHNNASPVPVVAAQSTHAVTVPPVGHLAPSSPSTPPVAPPETKYHEIKSPIVGTFYRAPAPDADSYVEVGQIVQQKMVLCIIEAMKLMNEIESDIGGRIVKILVENGQPVEYNQTLFLIEPV